MTKQNCFSTMLWIISSLIISCFGQNCVFTDSKSNTLKLDLSAIAKKQLKYYDATSKDSNNWYNYTYSVCSNDLYCVPKSQAPAHVMIDQFSASLGECYWLAQWDDAAIQPSFDPHREMWAFKYNGMPCDSAFLNERNTTVYWHCNKSVEYEIRHLLQLNTCEYEIMIESKYACPQYPGEYCKWQISDEGELDLTSLSKAIIVGKDAKDSELIFVYSPCRNAVQCNDLNVMIKLDNVTTANGCDTSLALWQESINGGTPTYDVDKGIWKFAYVNGQMCDGLDSTLFVYWYCDESVVNPAYEVLYAEKIEPCLYDISIASSLACGKHKAKY